MPIGARKDGIIYCVTVAPDVCLTPVGGEMVPVPYQLYADLSGSLKCIDSVRFNRKPAYVFDHSLAPIVRGDEPGTGGGIVSHVNKGRVWADHASLNVRANRYRVVRVGDLNWMNVKVM
jgi:hypothetical protein